MIWGAFTRPLGLGSSQWDPHSEIWWNDQTPELLWESFLDWTRKITALVHIRIKVTHLVFRMKFPISSWAQQIFWNMDKWWYVFSCVKIASFLCAFTDIDFHVKCGECISHSQTQSLSLFFVFSWLSLTINCYQLLLRRAWQRRLNQFCTIKEYQKI